MSVLDLLSDDKIGVGRLRAIFPSLKQIDGIVPATITALRQLDPEYAWRAAWLLERFAREGLLSDADVTRLAGVASEIDQWTGRLILCQLFTRRKYPDQARAALFPFLADCFRDRHVIVRAWAISALLLMRDDPEYRSEIDEVLSAARNDRRPSMQARLRRLNELPTSSVRRQPPARSPATRAG